MDTATLSVSPAPRYVNLNPVAEAFVQRHQRCFDGWPSRTTYMHDLHCDKLARLRPLLPPPLSTLRRHKLWMALTEAVNSLRTRRAASYRSQVEIENWDAWEES